MKYTIAICEDNPRQRNYIQRLIETALSPRRAVIDGFESAEALLASVKGGYNPQIAVLDIRLTGMDGISLARELNEIFPGCCIIFLTGYSDYHSEVYDAEHIYFVLKDKAEEYLPKALEKALALLSPQSGSLLTLRFRGNAMTLLPEDILYIESARRKLIVHTLSGSYEGYGKLAATLSERQGRDFCHCHQSYMVNLRHVSGVERGSFLLRNGVEVPISRARLSEAKARFFDYFSGIVSGNEVE